MIIYTDGSGKGKIAWYNDDTEEFAINETSAKTGNEAEYQAVIRALEHFKDYISKYRNRFRRVDEVEIRSDSRLVVQQVNHDWPVKADNLRPLAMIVWRLKLQLKEKGVTITFMWISRKENKAGKMLG